ncbi:MAG: glycosyltransferase [Sumerlaeia bacterium]
MSEAKPANSAVTTPIRCLSILIPVYNEIRTLELLLNRVLAAPLPCNRELVIVDDYSTDGSREFLAEFEAKHPEVVNLTLQPKNGGKGSAIRTAIEKMTGDWAIIQDADLEYDPNEYGVILQPALEGIADVVYGSRFLTGKYRRAMFFWHTVANQGLTLFSNMLNDLNLTDMETCYKLVRADILKSLIIKSNGFDLEPELTAKLARWGARIYEVPISYKGRTYAEGKKIKLKDAFAALRAMIQYRFSEKFCNHDGFEILQAVRKAKRLNQWMYEQFAEHLGDEVLEAGAGIGNLTEYVLDKKRLVCLDFEDFYVERLRDSYGHLRNTRFERADLTKPEDLENAAKEGLFDSVFCLNVAEHIEHDTCVFQNFYNVLKPGGTCIILVPHDPSLYSKVDEILGHFRRYTKNELRRKLKKTGFQVEKVFGFNRLGGLGWHLSKKMGKTTLSANQMALFEGLMILRIPRILEKFPFHSHNSVIAIARKPLENDSK